jgi:hypothetical protein
MGIKRIGYTVLHKSACWPLLPLLMMFIVAGIARAESAAFDLSGPRVAMKVTRAGKTLPISEVPDLQPGDRLWIRPELPEDQSVHYLLVVAFLRGSTNPPPENWFTKVEVWNKQTREEGIVVTVPREAQQALLFLAPETGGDYATLRSAVRGKPGVFVRASQDLNQASLDRSRLDRYLGGIKETSESDPQALHNRSALLARTLNMKLDQQCFDKPSEQQAPCLAQNTDHLVLDDGHSQSMVAALTSGPSSDLVGALSATSIAGGGFYSPYVGAVVDLVRIMSSLHTAEYQYIPALALPQQEQLNLRLNNPPSFRKPKSVLVVGLPAVEAAQLPPLRAMNQDQVFCLQEAPLALPVDGAPLVFSRDIAHDFVLTVKNGSGVATDLPATPDPATGGFLIDTRGLKNTKLDSDIIGTLRGYWGFQPFDGPSFHLRSAHSATWMVSSPDETALVVGREDALHLQSECAVCVDQVTVEDAHGKDLKTVWKPVKTDELEVRVTLNNDTSGPVKMAVKQFGLAKPDELTLRTYSEAAHLDQFTINAGDREGVLKGTRLDEVESLEMTGTRFAPTTLARADQKDELRLSVASGAPIAFQADQKLAAHVALKDGRILELQTTVDTPRPKVDLISKNIEPGPKSSAIRLGKQDELPQNGRISFLLKTDIPEQFPRSEKVEVATSDGSFDALLSVADSTLILQDSQTVLAVLDPIRSFGSSAFGQLRFRVVDGDDRKGDWEPLANLVRLPSLKEIHCPDGPDKQCKLTGTDLFLIDSVASDSQFTHTTPVPIGFVDATLPVPRPNGTLLYIKLRDDPATVSMMILPVLPDEQ